MVDSRGYCFRVFNQNRVVKRRLKNTNYHYSIYKNGFMVEVYYWWQLLGTMYEWAARRDTNRYNNYKNKRYKRCKNKIQIRREIEFSIHGQS